MTDILVLVVIIGVCGLLFLFVHVIVDNRWLYWFRSEEHKDMSFNEWKGYRYRWKELMDKHKGWGAGFDRADREWREQHKDE